MQRDDDEWTCPSFNSYSVAAKVAGEVAGDIELTLSTIPENDKPYLNDEDDEGNNLDFAFTLNQEFDVSSFPVFNGEMMFEVETESVSSSSSEHDEMESILPGSYCVWKPKVVEPPSPSTCKKSKSTGFGSKRWKLRDLLRRSNSEGKDSFVFLTPRPKHKKQQIESHTWSTEATKGPTGISKAAKALLSTNKSTTTKTSGLGSSSPTRRMIYTPANRDIMRGNETPNKGNVEMPKRKSYLPYRQDLVGFFTTVNSLGRNFSQLKMK